MTEVINKCSKIIYSGSFNQHETACKNKAKVEVDGRHYCGIHNPNKAPTKAQIEAAKNLIKDRARWRLERAAPDLLEALQLLVSWADELHRQDRAEDLRKARAVMAKAIGESQ